MNVGLVVRACYYLEMMDKLPRGQESGSDEDGLNAERRAAYQARKGTFEEIPIPLEKRREAGPEIVEFKAMVARFEQTHDLEALHAIRELSLKDSRSHPVREPARLDLIPIENLYNTIRKETNIITEQLAELEAQRKRLQNALGSINSATNIVRHE